MDERERKDELLITRREALKLAGFTVAGATISMACGGAEALAASKEQKAELTASGSESQFFPNLFTPLSIGTFTVRNRILSTAHFTGFAKHGVPSEKHKNYWGSKAKGGIGLIITEVQPIHPTAGITPSMIQNYRDDIIPAFKPVVDEVHRYGAKLIAQVWHPGSSTLPYAVSELVSASDVPSKTYGGKPRPLAVDEIKALVKSYGKSAYRLRKAGLDGVEIHCAHKYLPQQFMSPLYNRRTDEYGGSEENRIRFPMEIIEAVRTEVGDDFTVGIRITADEFTEDGLQLKDMKRIVKMLTASGKLDYVNVSLDGPDIIAPMGRKHGAYVYLAEEIKKVVNMPVFCIGRITDPAMAESIILKERADMVGMTRANMADPELANKAKQGRADEIRTCIGLMLCWSRTNHPEGVTCALNPSVGNEETYKIVPAEVKKKVMVVGSGIAGMEAARVSAQRGHLVTLIEKENWLGGQLVIASKAPTREEMAKPIEYYKRHFEKLKVNVQLNTTVTKEMILQENPDTVIIATGGVPGTLDVPGGDSKHVVQGRDVLLGLVKPGRNVVVVGSEGGMEVWNTAEFIADQGNKVEVVLPYRESRKGVEMVTSYFLFDRLDGKHAEITVNTTVEKITGNAVIVSTRGKERLIEGVDSVVLCLGSTPNDDLLKAMERTAIDMIAVGQCRKVGKLADSVLEGLKAGLNV